MENEMLVSQYIKERECQVHQADSDKGGKEGQQQGFRQELAYQRSSHRSQYFTDTDLFGAFTGTGGAEVDKIDAGDQLHKQGHRAKHVDVADVPVGLELAGECGME